MSHEIGKQERNSLGVKSETVRTEKKYRGFKKDESMGSHRRGRKYGGRNLSSKRRPRDI